MFNVIGIVFTSILITFFELPHLVKNKLRKESLVFLLLLSIGTFLCSLLALGITVPNPIDWLIKTVQPLSHWLNYYI